MSQPKQSANAANVLDAPDPLNCVHGYLHDWRLSRSWDETHYDPPPDPTRTTAVLNPQPAQVTRYDEWYCTRCRVIEVRQRV